MPFSLSETQQSQAWELAASRHAMPTHLGTADLRKQFSRSMRERVHVMARVSSARFASEVKQAVDLYMAGKKSMPVLIAHLQSVIQRLGYTPETGFPGDARLGIPAAAPGSLQDLSSWKRLKLIIETEAALAHGRVKAMRNRTPISMALTPALELVRIGHAIVPRDWRARWIKAGGPPLVNGRMIAPKGHRVWRNLGDHSLFPDGLGTDHDPFAFGSHMIQRGVSRGECQRQGLINARGQWAPGYEVDSRSRDQDEDLSVMPPALVNTATLEPVVAKQLEPWRAAMLARSKARQVAFDQQRRAA